ncbi:MAG: hypothetical protein LZF62_40035 [Nitrospira sp.]|nr:MAG: hypothetical protein LZF62_40035 [Nitrospira sp.]
MTWRKLPLTHRCRIISLKEGQDRVRWDHSPDGPTFASTLRLLCRSRGMHDDKTQSQTQ